MSEKDDDFGGKAFLLALLMAASCFAIMALVPPLELNKVPGGLREANNGLDADNKEESFGDIVSKEKDRRFRVVSVIDGDTIKIDYFGTEESVRLIGINTPEVNGPYTEEQCYGEEASAYTKERLEGKYVTIATDSTQGNRDKYDRLLRYIGIDNEDFGSSLIMNGYAYEYTYDKPYEKQGLYKQSQEYAVFYKKGLWGVESCAVVSNESGNLPKSNDGEAKVEHIYGESGDCNIKGNISYNTGEKIYHVPGQEYYNETVISPEYGERWFCSEEEARAAGWRRANEPITGTIEYRSSEGNEVVVEKDEDSSDSEDYIHEGAGYREVEDKAYLAETNNNDQSEVSPEEVNTDNMKNSRRGRLIVSILCFLFAITLTIMWIAMITSAFHGKHKAGALLSILLLPAIIATLIAMSRLLIEIIE